ncbi:MAG TPA: DUF72 domain-containing protein [Tepidiformaceae bacterium]
MPGQILLGTASWTDKPLIESGRFYPESARTPEERLRYYASQFPLVEADTTYYGLPQQSMVQNWAERTPDGFTFDVKAYSLFTEHPAPVQRLPKDIQQMLPKNLASVRNLYRKDAPPDIIDACWSTFIDGVLPLHDRGKLGVVVFQFPKWVFPNRRTWDYFEEIRHRLGPYRAAFEFRNDVWMRADNREDTLARLGDLGFTYICVDEPQGFSSSVPPVVAATTDIGFVRFHGRNRQTWEKRTKTSSERFDYWYKPEEFDEWLPGFRDLASNTREVHAVMNTNNYDQGPENLRRLGERLRAAGLPLKSP